MQEGYHGKGCGGGIPEKDLLTRGGKEIEVSVLS